MTDIPRRKIDELRARYELEPTIHDLYVEGIFDQDVLSRYIEKKHLIGLVVYTIDTVEVPSALLHENGLTPGEKQEVIALARQLASIPGACSYRCIVDRDLGEWLGRIETTPRLLWTKYCSLELYFFTEELLREVLVITAKSRISDFSRFVGSVVRVLRELYSVRLADAELGWAMKWLDFEDHLIKQSSWIEFNEQEYVRRLLMKNGRIK